MPSAIVFSRDTTHKVTKMTFFVTRRKDPARKIRLERGRIFSVLEKLKSPLNQQFTEPGPDISAKMLWTCPWKGHKHALESIEVLGSFASYVRVEWTKEMGYSNKEEIV
jgi:hypothetical protein